jgi:cysteine desulfurase
VEIAPLLVGGRQERGRRAGTENPALAVALAEACSLERPELSKLRDRLERGILERVPDVKVNSGGVERTPNTSNLMFEGIGAEALLIALDLRGFAVSTGSACSSGSVEPSHVLLAMGLSPEEARASVRFSLGAGNDEAQVDALAGAVEEAVAQLRRLSPAYAS